MATKTKKKNTSSYKKKNTKAQSSARHISKEAALIIVIVVAILLELCNFKLLGTVGGWIKYVQFGLFGMMAYLFPVLLAGVIIIKTFSKVDTTVKVVFSSVFYIGICMLTHLISNIDMNLKLTDYFTIGATESKAGGIVGGAFAVLLYLAVQKTGSYIIITLILLLCIFMFFKTTLISTIRSLIDGDEYDDHAERRRSKKIKIRDNDDEPDKVVIPKSKQTKNNRDIPVYETEENGTTIRIVHTPKKRINRHVPLKRSGNKAASMRDGYVVSTRANNKAKGVGQNVAVIPANAGGDEVHEITRTGKAYQTQDTVTQSAGQQRESVLEVTDISGRDNTYDSSLSQNAATGEITWNTPDTDTDPLGVFDDDETDALGRSILEQINEEPVKAASEKPRVRTVVREKKEETEMRSTLSGKTFSKGEATRTVTPVTTFRGKDDFILPSFSNLKSPDRNSGNDMNVNAMAKKLEATLESFGVHAEVVDTQIGPSVTRFELHPAMGTKVSKFTSLADDLKLNLAVKEIRIEAPIPGKAAVGIEVPNKTRNVVRLRELLESPDLMNHKSKIAFAAGKDISGNVVVCDLAKMPHLLVAGTTGSGKSVFLNSILMCILYRAKPSEVGLIIVDPKKVEFGIYSGIPNLIRDVVTDPGQAVATLRWAVDEMTKRYQRMQMSGVRDFKSYNDKFDRGEVNPDEENPRRMPQIVIIIDELADLMMVAAKEVEALICRLAQLARAAGIHLIIATQRPSVDVITGLIKANIPARAALLVASGVDSRTIIDMVGAEKLLGNGDMLFYPTGYVKPERLQGAFVDDDEIRKTCKSLISSKMADYYTEEADAIEKAQNSAAQPDAGSSSGEGGGKYDAFLREAGLLCIENGKASSSMLQRRLGIGFPRAAKIVDQLYEVGVIGPQNGAKPREILVDPATFEEIMASLE